MTFTKVTDSANIYKVLKKRKKTIEKMPSSLTFNQVWFYYQTPTGFTPNQQRLHLFGATALAPPCHGLGKTLPRPRQNSAKTFEKSGTPQTLPDVTTRIFGRTATLARFLLLNKTKEPQG